MKKSSKQQQTISVPHSQKERPVTITLSYRMAEDFSDIAAKIGWSRSTVIRRCLAASIKAVRQFEKRHEDGL